MASNREERRQQRQRGAQKHQVRDADFGDLFATAPVPSQRITRSGATPQPELLPQPSSRKTPGVGGHGEPSGVNSVQKRAALTPTPIPSDANISAKRRKIEVVQDNRRSSPARSSRSRTTPRRDLYSLEEGAPLAESGPRPILRQPSQGKDELGDEADNGRPLQTPRSARVAGPEEITESPREAPGSGQRRQTNIQGTQGIGMKLASAVVEAGQSGGPGGQATTPIHLAQTQTARLLSGGLSPSLPIRHSPKNRPPSSEIDEVDELSPDNRTRKSAARPEQELFSDVEYEQQDGAEMIDDIEAAQILRRQKGKSGRDALEWEVEEQEPEQGDEEEELEENDEPAPRPKNIAKKKKGRPKASPTVQRQPKKSRAKSNKGIPNKSDTGESIPVVVHRLTKPIHYGEDDTDADLLNEDIPFAKRSGVNAVDVLSQFCEEIIESGIAALEDGGSVAEDSTTRREYRTKLRAVEAFQEELRTRLLELTLCLDTDYHLNRRVRSALKQKIQLREDLLGLRSQREQIALRMDEVRIKHETENNKAQEKARINTHLHDIELAVSLGMERTASTTRIPEVDESELTNQDVVIKLGALAEEVSSNSGQGGLLRQVRDFNAFLERAALAMESK